MVLCLWRPARQAECRAPSLEGVRLQLLCKVVTLPLHLPEEGKKGQNVQLGAKDKQHLHTLQWNTEGIFHKKTPPKIRLENEKISIVCIQETHLNPENRFSIRGYQAFRMDRMGHKGGVMILDLNSHSTSWRYEASIARGYKIEDWQSETKMVNDPDDPPTFYSRRWMTTSTPDLAFASGSLANKIQRNVTIQLGGNDHRPELLTMDLEWKQKDEKTIPRWNHKKANWNLFSQLTNKYSKMIKTYH